MLPQLQVWTADAKKHLGTSASQGPGGTAPPLRRTFLTANSWDGKFHPVDAEDTSGPGPLQLQIGRTYRLKLELFPVTAAADRIAGREVEQESLVIELDTKLQLVDSSADSGSNSDSGVQAPEGSGNTKASTKSRKSGAGSSKGSKSRSKSSAKRTHGHSRQHAAARIAARVQNMGINLPPYVALEL